MIKVIRAYDQSSNEHTFSIIATDKGFTYVFSDNAAPMFDSKAREKKILDRVDAADKKLDVEDYLKLATLGLSSFYFGKVIDAPSQKLAMKTEKLALEHSEVKNEGMQSASALASIAEDTDQVLQDYPELYDQLASEDPDQEITASGMIELVFAALGSVDPNGPNAWLLDYMDGQEADGYVAPLSFRPDSAQLKANETENK